MLITNRRNHHYLALKNILNYISIKVNLITNNTDSKITRMQIFHHNYNSYCRFYTPKTIRYTSIHFNYFSRSWISNMRIRLKDNCILPVAGINGLRWEGNKSVFAWSQANCKIILAILFQRKVVFSLKIVH